MGKNPFSGPDAGRESAGTGGWNGRKQKYSAKQEKQEIKKYIIKDRRVIPYRSGAPVSSVLRGENSLNTGEEKGTVPVCRQKGTASGRIISTQ